MATNTTDNVNININVNADDSMRSVRQMRNDLKDMMKQMDEAAATGDRVKFEGLKQSIGELRNDIKDLSAEMKYTDPGELLAGFTKIAQGVVGGFGAVTGAMELFGSSTEDVQEIQKKSLVIIQTLQSLEEIRSLFEARGAVRGIANSVARVGGLIAETVATGTLTTATAGFNAMLLANPIGAVIAGVLALTAAAYGLYEVFVDENVEIDKSNANLKEFDEAIKNSTKATRDAEMALANKRGLLSDEDYARYQEREKNKERIFSILETKKTLYLEAELKARADIAKLLDTDDPKAEEKLLEVAKNKGRIQAQIDKKTKDALASNTKAFLVNMSVIQEEANQKKIASSKTADTKIVDNSKEQLQKIIDLQNEAIVDEDERKAAQIETAYNREVEKAKKEIKNKEILAATLLALQNKFDADMVALSDSYVEKVNANEKTIKDNKKATDEENTRTQKENSDKEIALAKETADAILQLKLDVAGTDAEIYDAKVEILDEQYAEDLIKYKDNEEAKALITQKYEQDKADLKYELAKATEEKILGVLSAGAELTNTLMQGELEAAGDNEEEKTRIRKKYAGIQAGIDIATTTVQTYMAAAAALSPPPVGAGPLFGPILAGITIASGLARVALVAQQYKKITAEKGMLVGASHAQGGIPIEAEGGEAILNKRSMSNPILRALASDINVAGGGVPFVSNSNRLTSNTSSIMSTIEPSVIEDIVNKVTNKISSIPVIVTEYDITKIQRKVKVIEDRSQIG